MISGISATKVATPWQVFLEDLALVRIIIAPISANRALAHQTKLWKTDIWEDIVASARSSWRSSVADEDSDSRSCIGKEECGCDSDGALHGVMLWHLNCQEKVELTGISYLVWPGQKWVVSIYMLEWERRECRNLKSRYGH